MSADGVTFYDMSDLNGNVWHAANGILVSYLMSSPSMLFQGGTRTWSGVILNRRVLQVSGQTQVKAVPPSRALPREEIVIM